MAVIVNKLQGWNEGGFWALTGDRSRSRRYNQKSKVFHKLSVDKRILEIGQKLMELEMNTILILKSKLH